MFDHWPENSVLKITSIESIHLKQAEWKVNKRKKTTMGDHSSYVYWPKEENLEEEEEEATEEEPEEEEDSSNSKEEDSSSSEEEQGEVKDDEPDYDPWRPVREKVGEDLKEPYMKEVQRFLDRGKTQDYAENAAFNTLLPVSRRRLRKTYLERLKWTYHIQHDAIHRKVMKSLKRFIGEDDMDFEEAAESAVAKRKFLLNRLMQKKLLPDESDDDKEEAEENDILASETQN